MEFPYRDCEKEKGESCAVNKMGDNVNFSSLSSRNNILQGRVFSKHPEKIIRGVPITKRLWGWDSPRPLLLLPPSPLPV